MQTAVVVVVPKIKENVYNEAVLDRANQFEIKRRPERLRIINIQGVVGEEFGSNHVPTRQTQLYKVQRADHRSRIIQNRTGIIQKKFILGINASGKR